MDVARLELNCFRNLVYGTARTGHELKHQHMRLNSNKRQSTSTTTSRRALSLTLTRRDFRVDQNGINRLVRSWGSFHTCHADVDDDDAMEQQVQQNANEAENEAIEVDHDDAMEGKEKVPLNESVDIDDNKMQDDGPMEANEAIEISDVDTEGGQPQPQPSGEVIEHICPSNENHC